MNEKKLRIGVFGAGRISKVHTPNLVNRVSGVEVVAIADPKPGAAQELADRLNIGRVYTEDEPILNDPSIDAVFVCASTDAHTQLCIRAARAGKHIFCEKPVDHDVGKIREVIAEVEKAGVKFQVGFNRRFDRNFWHLHEVARAGGVGEVQLVKISSRDPVAPPLSYVRGSGGIFVDMTIHDFDMVQYLSGSRVVEVSAMGACLINPQFAQEGDVDTCIVKLRLESGALAVIDNSRQAVYGYDQRIEVFGSKGMIMAENERPDNSALSTAEGVFTQKPLYFFLERYTEAFVYEEQCFVDACLNDTPTLVTARESLSPVLIALAAKESCDKGGAPVTVAQE